MKKIKVIQTCYDANCPICDYPEILRIRDAKTMEIYGERCSSKKCGYFVLFVIK